MSPPVTEESNVSPEIVALRDQCDALQGQIQRLHVLQDIGQELVSELDHARLMHNILRSAAKVMEANAGSLILLDETTDELVFEVVEGGGGEVPEEQLIEGLFMAYEEAQKLIQMQEKLRREVGKPKRELPQIEFPSGMEGAVEQALLPGIKRGLAEKEKLPQLSSAEKGLKQQLKRENV